MDKTKTSDFIGVSWYENSRQWKTQATNPLTKRKVHLGYFENEQEAADVRICFDALSTDQLKLSTTAIRAICKQLAGLV